MKNLKYQWTNFIKWLNKPKKLSEKTEKKFVESIRVEDWEVLTEDGYKPIYSTNQTIEYDVYILYFENGYKLRCADNHILIDHQGDEVFSKDAPGKYFISDDLRFDLVQCVRVEKTNKKEVMYDLTVNSKDHTYYTNGILSHNSITTLAWLLHYALFNSDKTIAILANKGATAREMLARITLMLENIPFFMQPGCKELNKGSIHFSNNSKIIAASTSSSSIRGFAINCVPDYTKTTVMLDDGQIYYNTISKIKEIINEFEQTNSPKYTMKINSKKYYTVYKITNKINNKEYIGFHSTNDLDDGYMGSGKLIQKAYEKYGLEHFEKEYIEIFDSLKEDEDLEKELVNEEYVERGDTYNMSISAKKRPPLNKGLVYCYNQITLEKKMCKAEEVPEVWNLGFLKK